MPARRDAPRTLLDRLHSVPLRSRLLGVVLGLTLVALVLTTAAVSALLRGYLFTQAEQELDIYLTAITKTEVAKGPGLPTGFTAKLLSADGTTVETLGEAATESDRAAIPFLLPTDPRVTSGRTFVIDSVGDSDRTWLAVAQATANGSGTYVLALPLRPLDATVDQFRWYAAGIGAFALLVCGLVGWLLIGRTFRPLTRIEDTAAGIAAGDLTRRVDVPDTDDEVASLSRSLNAMLARIERSFAVREANEAKMRRFIADASHELRTPLAAVGGYAELYRQGALPTTEAVTGAMGRIESETHRMSGLVEDLLTLARLDGERPLELQPVDLAVLAADAAQDARTIDSERPFAATGIDGPIEPTELRRRRAAAAPGRHQPRHQRAGPHPGRVSRSRSSSAPSPAARRRGSPCTCATTAPAYRSPTASTSSSASIAPTGRAAATTAAATDWGSRSWRPSWPRTAARSGSPTRRAGEPPSSSSCPCSRRRPPTPPEPPRTICTVSSQGRHNVVKTSPGVMGPRR